MCLCKQALRWSAFGAGVAAASGWSPLKEALELAPMSLRLCSQKPQAGPGWLCGHPLRPAPLLGLESLLMGAMSELFNDSCVDDSD